jgi:uncharacterized protein YdhG (YjbR/CyaY superfamily)
MIGHMAAPGNETAPSPPAGVEEYLAALPGERRAALEMLRATIRAAAPEAAEVISYRMPAFTVGGRLLVSYASFTTHDSLFPASGAVREALGDELAPYVSGKGTIRFPVGRPIPAALVARIVAVRLAEVAGRRG